VSTVGISNQKGEEMNGSAPSMTVRTDRDGPLVAALRQGDPRPPRIWSSPTGARASRLAN